MFGVPVARRQLRPEPPPASAAAGVGGVESPGWVQAPEADAAAARLGAEVDGLREEVHPSHH